MDPQSQKFFNLLHPKLIDDAIAAWTICQTDLLDHPNVQITVTQSLRTFEESDELFKLGRTKVNPDGRSPSKPFGNIVTNAPGGSSYHNYGLAFDFKMITNGHDDWDVGPLWRRVAATMKEHGWTWGGDFKKLADAPHFEKTFGFNWKALLVKHNAGDFIPGTQYVNI
ncbi:M15 family metallopeptidase [Mucilaginibacter sabulilitoris]|uniref:M15 family metallopeptidase n=1 Tax=Mucilaginibacter sabulilitoris TaxID=1173583 RepID=A0ABZ0TNB0_9SPHI|nr:M15 family metallopeptidase [Mucilaginibacter sabulilitoris]WPU94276.1 M15 family metallopeptidase [Mucilaginibacter sabulilitoris]